MPPLTDDRIREVFRKFTIISIAGDFARIPLMMLRLWARPAKARADEIAAQQAASKALLDDRARIFSIVRLIALLGVEEARAQAGPLSVHAEKNWRSIRRQPWKYTLWEHALLLTAVSGEGPTPVLPDEVDSVARVLDEILARDQKLRRDFEFGQETAARLNADPESRTKRAGKEPRYREARKWLGRKRHPPVLAANRFGTTEAGLAFVEELYAAGATSVVVPGDTIDEGDDDYPAHSDTLVVRLPQDPAARSRLLDIAAREAVAQQVDRELDQGQDELRLWWD
jgi:hypothetical protein